MSPQMGPLSRSDAFALAGRHGAPVASIVLSGLTLLALDGRVGDLGATAVLLIGLAAFAAACTPLVRRRGTQPDFLTALAVGLAVVTIVSAGLVVAALHDCRVCD